MNFVIYGRETNHYAEQLIKWQECGCVQTMTFTAALQISDIGLYFYALGVLTVFKWKYWHPLLSVSGLLYQHDLPKSINSHSSPITGFT
jgi:hypothetical protein